jgi:hypothetical protein
MPLRRTLKHMNRIRSTISSAIPLAMACCLLQALPVCAQPKTGGSTVESRTITVRIDRPFDKVYEFLVDPAHWNQWAFGLGKNLRKSSNGWVADSGGGTVRVRFTPRNNFGVVDHTVTRPKGDRVYIPMRLIVNGGGCELLFTLFREPNMSDAQFASDANFVQRDLDGLKGLMEK